MNVHGVELIEAGDMVCRAYKANGENFEPYSLSCWRQSLRTAGAVGVDVGAYTGLYTLVAMQLGAMVHAFEPNPANYERLGQNLELNPKPQGGLALYQAAAGDREARGTLWDTKNRPPLTSAGKVCEDLNGSVTVATLDSLNLTRCDVIKVDVEGAELAVLRGAERTIQKFLPRLILEANTAAEWVDLDVHLEPFGYPPGVRADGRNVVYTYA